MKEICSNQGRFHLVTVASASTDEHYVNSQIAQLAQQTKRPAVWIRSALQRERLFPQTGLLQTRDLRVHTKRCRRYINTVVNSLDATKSAARLNIGIKGFESLVDGGVLSRMRSRSYRKRRFLPSDLDQILMLLDRNANERVQGTPPGYCSIPEACFQLGPTTAQITRLLIGGQLPSSVRLEASSGFAALRIDRVELHGAMKIFSNDHINPRELTKQLGLSFGELKTQRELHVLPSFPYPTGEPHRSVKCISRIVLDRFSKKYQTVTTAARYLDADERETHKIIASAKIVPVAESHGVSIFRRSDLLD